MRASSAYGTQLAGRYDMKPLLGCLYGDCVGRENCRRDMFFSGGRLGSAAKAGVNGYVESEANSGHMIPRRLRRGGLESEPSPESGAPGFYIIGQ